jgi:hypothetical protein
MPLADLSINEGLMLLALDDAQGKVRWAASPYLEYALAGGALAELVRQGRLALGEDGVIRVESSVATGSNVLDGVLGRVASAKSGHTVVGWVAELSGESDLQHLQLEELVARGILERHEERVMFFFPTIRYPQHDATPEKLLLQRIEEALRSTGDVEPRLAALITIANGARLLQEILPEELLDASQGRLAELAKTRPVAGATCDMIRESERALFVASSIPFMGVPQI